jgi:hypothetical protein
MPYSDSYANAILNYTFAKIDKLEAPDFVYIGLCSNDPEAGGGTFNELSGAGYERVLIHQRGEVFPGLINSASERAITNGKQINWTKATLDWERVNGFGLFSAKQGGAPFFYGKIELTEEQQAAGGLLVAAGSVALFDPQTLRISFPTTDISEAAVTVSE